jgi:hypothetical protein
LIHTVCGRQQSSDDQTKQGSPERRAAFGAPPYTANRSTLGFRLSAWLALINVSADR